MSQYKELFVNDLKIEFINAIMMSLKIDSNPFIIATIDEFIAHIKPTEYKSFMTELFGTQHAYLNGLDRVAKVAEQFKPQVQENPHEAKAKELIQWCETANATVFDGAKKSGTTFDDEMNHTGFVRLINESETMAILNAVKPYCDFKQLIGNISCYQDSQVQLQAFIDALKYTPTDAIQIAYVTDRLRIKR